MARRNDHTKEEIRSMVIEEGFNLIKDLGFSNFSTRKIAKEIGYTVGTLYNVFENYDDIILHINAKTLDKMRVFIEDRLNQTLKGEKSAKQLAKLYIDFANENYNIWSALFEYNMPSDISIPDWYNLKVEKLFNIVAEIISKSLQKDSDCLEHAKVIWAGIHGICILSLTQKLRITGIKSIENLTDSLIENYLRGIES